MTTYRFIKTFIISSILLLSFGVSPSFCQDHIKELDGLRASMSEIGNELPEMIRTRKNDEMRTLERVYEINTYALTTIEAYFKMIKVAVVSEGKINKEEIAIFNGWLEFISKYCEKDTGYLDEALSDMKDPAIVNILQREKTNIKNLREISVKAISENDNLLKRK